MTFHSKILYVSFGFLTAKWFIQNKKSVYNLYKALFTCLFVYLDNFKPRYEQVSQDK